MNQAYDGSIVNLTYTTDETAKYLCCRIYHTSLDTGVSLENMLGSIQIEEGSTATDYVVHEEQNIDFPLSTGQQFYEGDYLADDGVHHTQWQYVITGNENFTLNRENDTARRYAVDSVLNKDCSTSNSRAFSNYFQSGTASTTQTVPNTISSRNAAGIHLTFDVNDTNFNTVEKVKAWLAEKYASNMPVIMKYYLAEEYIEPYTSEQQAVWNQIKALRTYKNITHMDSSNNVPPTINLKYVADTKIYIDNKVTTLTNAITSLGGNV